jgi:hypothetical protein
MHHHKAAWNALLFGRKLWVLVPPPDASFCRDDLAVDLFATTGRGWLDEAVQRAKGGSSSSNSGGGGGGGGGGRGGGSGGGKTHVNVKNSAQRRRFYCVQREGDVLYVPAGWGHSTLNLQVT